MPIPATIRDELASVPELASLNLDRAALRIAERKPLIEPIAGTGRYQISVDLCFDSRVVSESTRCDDIEVARATLAVFKRTHAANGNALGEGRRAGRRQVMGTYAAMMARAQRLPNHQTEALTAEPRASIWSNAARVAGTMVVLIHGPRPEAKWPSPNNSLGMVERDRDYGERMAVFTEAKIGQEKWDRRHRALTRALATEARRIEDRSIAMGRAA